MSDIQKVTNSNKLKKKTKVKVFTKKSKSKSDDSVIEELQAKYENVSYTKYHLHNSICFVYRLILVV